MIRLSEAIARANCTAEITPAFVREAYSLLRQSIIHVEKDDINLDEDEEDERRGQGAPVATDESQGDVDMEMDGAGISAPTLTSPSRGAGTSYAAPTSPGTPARSAAGGQYQPLQLTTPQVPSAPPKRKLKITHDKYMTMQSLVVLHLGEIEKSGGGGVEREALIDWYLEKKEGEGAISNLEELEYEKELFTKVLAKLVKVYFPIYTVKTAH